MSYITIPRLAFSGNFQADVSTVNNDVRHYDIATWKARFQDPQTATEANGWYNPDGTGNFRLFGISIHQALSEFGADPTTDPATGLFVNAQEKRSSCKIVDLDPQMQVVSTLFGLRIVLTDGTKDYLSGDYTAAPFRDMANGRAGAQSALYNSVLTNLEWSEIAQTSPTLVALKAAADQNGGKLSINLTPYGYGANQEGLLVGSIGTYSTGDPLTFVSGRRLVNGAVPANQRFIGEMMADQAGSVLSFDFSNSVAMRNNTTVFNVGALHGAILRQTDQVAGLGTDAAAITVGVVNGSSLSGSELKLLDPINYQDPAFLSGKAGLADCHLDNEALALIVDHPVAIVRQTAADQYDVVIRETNGGLYARADNFVQRMDPPMQGTASAVVNFKVSQWGKPIAGVRVVTEAQGNLVKNPAGTFVTNGYWGPGGSGPTDPQAPYPPINTPTGIADVSTLITSGADGWAACPVSVKNPANPRGYVDGQIYTSSYLLAAANASPQSWLDLVVIHARDAHDYPDPPSWDDIEPFMRQYDNLYPIMSRHLFSLSDPEVFKRNATLLTLAFSRPMDDPNHMPATRDLSNSNRQAVLNWLAQHSRQPAPLVEPDLLAAGMTAGPMEVVSAETSHLPRAQPGSIDGLEAMLAQLEQGSYGKNPVLRSYLSAEIAGLKQGDVS